LNSGFCGFRINGLNSQTFVLFLRILDHGTQ
jgi:hypothetical protein